jgi:hypothetical protein
MKKITGVKSVDFKVIAKGRGIVNWNGSIDGEFGSSHSVPKMTNFSMYKTITKEDGTTFQVKNSAQNIDFTKSKIFVSQNCIRNALFKEECPYHLDLKAEDATDLLKSLIGTLRGFAIADGSPLMRKSPLMVSDFIATNNEVTDVEIKAKTASKDVKGTIFSQTSQGKVDYEGIVSLSVEEIQFISLDNTYGRASSLSLSEEEGTKLAKEVENSIKKYSNNEGIKVTYGIYKRINSVSKGGEIGLLLNEEAIDALVEVTLDKLSNLQIMKNKGFLVSDNVKVRYNQSIFSEEIESVEKTSKYAEYYRLATKEEVEEREEASSTQSGNKKDKKEAKEEKAARKSKKQE